MKRGMATALAIAGIFALSACGNPNGNDDVINEPVPGEEQQLPGDENMDDNMNDDMDDNMDDDLDDELEDELDDTENDTEG